ncbi:MAG: DUF5686 and carboxypeptidase regulatory-like domain-containing protein [Bacteroidales bacterium]|nr:DUF5686 and carboxypeptidase regulatory-like domain-containing protein [Bacteroidales bacterium]
MDFKLYLTLFLTALLSLTAHADANKQYYVSGIVRDSLTLEPLPFASVVVAGEVAGTLSNEKGIFEITAPEDAQILQVACLGYEKKLVPIRKGMVNLYDVKMSPTATVLNEVVVRKQKYSKKNNPAVEFAKRIKDSGQLTDPERNPYYSYDKYEIITFALNDFTEKEEGSWLMNKFPFLWDHVDTSEISGKPILNIMAKEKASECYYRKSPTARKEVVTGVKQNGFDEIADQQGTLAFLEDVLREIDVYDNDINILQNRFVSPLSRIAPDFYKFYLTDTVEVRGERCIVLSFYPHNTASFGFNGQVFVPVNDSTMFIKKVTMKAPRNINLNFIENLYISQEFDRAPDGSRLKAHDDMTIELKIVPGKPGFYVRRNVAYANHSFEAAADESIYSTLGNEITTAEAKERDEEFWSQARLLNVTENESNVDDLMRKLRGVPLYYWTEKVLKILFTGYINLGPNSKFDYGPVNTTISHNSLEGWRLRAGGMTTANLSKRWFGRGYVAYGFKDHKWKYGAEVEYSFIDKEYHSREFPMNSFRLTSRYDVDQIGQHYMFTNQDNIFISLKRMSDFLITYKRENRLEYNLELRNNFSVCAAIANEIQESTPYMQFTNGYGESIKDFSETSLSVELRYAPGEKFYQAKSFRIPLNLDAPVFILRHTIAPKGWLGSKYMVNFTEASVQKRFWFSAFGFADVLIKGGHVWSQSPYLNLLIPNANLSYTIQPESFALMNPMEFVNDSYASWDLTYWLNGALFNFIPGWRQLRLREVVAFRGLWGHLSDKNDPSLHPELLQYPIEATVTRMSNRPYMEISAGLDNIFKCLRVDYVWRLSYRDVPYSIDRHGLRVAVHVTF